MDAWDTLLSKSTIQSGDAWEHLLAQGGGTGPGGSLVLLDGLTLEMNMMEYELNIEVPEYIIEIEDEFDIELETTEFELEIS